LGLQNFLRGLNCTLPSGEAKYYTLLGYDTVQSGGDNMLLWNVSNYLPEYIASQIIRYI